MKIRKLEDKGYKIYRRDRVAFAVNNLSLIAVTNLQSFLLRVDHPSQNDELRRIINFIQRRKINSTNELVPYCRYRPNDNELFPFFLGVQMMSINLESYPL